MNVVQIAPPKPGVPDLRSLDADYRCIVRWQGMMVTVAIRRELISPSKSYIMLGNQWFSVSEIEIVEVLEKLQPPPPPAKTRPWWKRLLRRP